MGQAETEIEGIDYESKMLLQFCKSNELLLMTYSSLYKLNTRPDQSSAHDHDVTNEVLVSIWSY